MVFQAFLFQASFFFPGGLQGRVRPDAVPFGALRLLRASSTESVSQLLVRPSGASFYFGPFTHGLRRGLHSGAAARLPILSSERRGRQQGLKAAVCTRRDAALKRRSSTVVPDRPTCSLPPFRKERERIGHPPEAGGCFQPFALLPPYPQRTRIRVGHPAVDRRITTGAEARIDFRPLTRR